MEFIVVTDSGNRPQMIALRNIVSIVADTQTPPKAIFMMVNGNVIQTNHNASDILARALNSGIAADLRN